MNTPGRLLQSSARAETEARIFGKMARKNAVARALLSAACHVSTTHLRGFHHRRQSHRQLEQCQDRQGCHYHVKLCRSAVKKRRFRCQRGLEPRDPNRRAQRKTAEFSRGEHAARERRSFQAAGAHAQYGRLAVVAGLRRTDNDSPALGRDGRHRTRTRRIDRHLHSHTSRNGRADAGDIRPENRLNTLLQ